MDLTLRCSTIGAVGMNHDHPTGDPPWLRHGWVERTQVLLDSFHRWLQRDLVPRRGSAEEQAQRLFEAPFVVVSHGTEEDPLLNYGNAAALELWEMDVETLLGTPSRLTAEAQHRDERAQLLERAGRHGFVDDYEGIRITGTGRRFRIENAIIWNLLDRDGRPAGQAATFSRWRFL